MPQESRLDILMDTETGSPLEKKRYLDLMTYNPVKTQKYPEKRF
jgi:hypothetical protein